MRLIDADAIPWRPNEDWTLHATAADIRRMPTIDPIRAAGGCRCGECKWYMAGGVCEWTSSDATKNLRDEDDFCSDGEPREAQGDA